MNIVTLLLFMSAMAAPAFAYIDPNAAGLVSQVLTPLLLLAGAAWAVIRRKVGGLTAIFRRARGASAGEADDSKS